MSVTTKYFAPIVEMSRKYRIDVRDLKSLIVCDVVMKGDDGAASGPIGRSCHDRVELAAATREGVDYITLSPLYATSSKPGHGPALGPVRGAELLAGSTPVAFALGGITPARATECLDAGFIGVATMGHVMGADDPAAVVSDFLHALRSPAVRP